MRIKVTSQESSSGIGDSGLQGKALVTDEDEVGYTCYDVVLEAGAKQIIKSAFGKKFNHIYYCIYGEITFNCNEGTTEILKTDHAIALTGRMEATVTAIEKTRLFITYVKETPEGPYPEKAFHYSLDKIIGTERDVDWFRGRSRRYLRKAEGFNVSLHNTLCYKEKSSPLHYPNNKETAYYIEGDIEYTWNDGKESHKFLQADRKDGDGASITMDRNDPHILNAGSLDCVTLCIFYPALKGNETHDFSKKVSSF